MLGGRRREESELFLPEELVAYASRWGDECAWRWKDLAHVAEAAEKREIASGGWQVLFRTPDGDCEVCWFSFFPQGMGDDESWPQYVGRSWVESRRMWRRLFMDEKLIGEGRKAFRLIREAEVPGLLPRDALRFVLYFRKAVKSDRKTETEFKRDAPDITENRLKEVICPEGSRSGPRTNDRGKSFKKGDPRR